MEILANYGIFLLKIITIIAAILIVFAGIVAISTKNKFKPKLKIKNLNKRYQNYADAINKEIMDKADYKAFSKEQKKLTKNQEKKPRVFLLHFHGDIRASAVDSLREEISAILHVAKPTDEVVVLLESPGGMVHGYGLAASQLKRIRERHIPLIICIDKLAASGGYLMACVAEKILAAPFAIIGSIGVVAQIPNFNRLLKHNYIDFEQITAGEYKRTLTLFGENTEKGREKFKEDLEQIHHLFKDFIVQHRTNINIQQVATGEHWLAAHAKDLHLVDEIMTSDDYLMMKSKTADIYLIQYQEKASLGKRLLSTTKILFDRIFYPTP